MSPTKAVLERQAEERLTETFAALADLSGDGLATLSSRLGA